MRKLLIGLLCLSILFTALGCTKNNDSPDFRGEITQVNISENNQRITILVEGKLEEDISYDKAYIAITGKTKIFRGLSNKKIPANELKEGIKVEGIFEGSVAESYPVQGTAKLIRILE